MMTALPNWLANDILPQGGLSPRQKQQWAAFIAAGLPTRHNERFKYTDLMALTQTAYVHPNLNVSERALALLKNSSLAANTTRLVLVNGAYQAALSTICDTNIVITELTKNNDSPLLNAEQYPFAALNAALSTSGLVIQVPADLKEKVHVHVINIADADNTFIAQPQFYIEVGGNSHLEWIEEYVSTQPNAYCMNVLTYGSRQE